METTGDKNNAFLYVPHFQVILFMQSVGKFLFRKNSNSLLKYSESPYRQKAGFWSISLSILCQPYLGKLDKVREYRQPGYFALIPIVLHKHQNLS